MNGLSRRVACSQRQPRHGLEPSPTRQYSSHRGSVMAQGTYERGAGTPSRGRTGPRKEAMDTPLRLCHSRDRARYDHASRVAQDMQDILGRRDYIISGDILPGAAMRPRPVL